MLLLWLRQISHIIFSFNREIILIYTSSVPGLHIFRGSILVIKL